jgi:L-asparaginase / beta-aspartyl-peptidase
VGAGTYANNDTVAVSATGTGELFIRQVAAYRVGAAMEYAHMKVDKAAQEAIDKVAEIGGPESGGLIALDGEGNLAMPFNTAGMYRGYATEDGEVVVMIFGDE